MILWKTKEEMRIDYKRYKVAYLYIKNFVHKEFPIGERFNYEPTPETVYRAIKDMRARPHTYRIVLSEKEGRDSVGIVFDKLKDSNHAWEHDIVELTFENIADVKLPDQEAEKINKWMGNEKEERKFIRWCLTPQKTEKAPEPKEEPEPAVKDVEYSDIMREIMTNFHAVAKGGDGVADVIVDLLTYLKTTYSDKYEDSSNPLDMKNFLYSRKHGAVINVFNATKYLNRYLSDGYRKSGNPIDLLKAMHYIAFELARLKLTIYAEQQREDKEPPKGGRPPKG
jgi:hypothetical protein